MYGRFSIASLASRLGEWISICLVSLFAMFLPLSAQSNEQTSAASLLDRALQNLYEDDFIQTMTLATQSGSGKEMRRRLQLTRRQSVRPGKALLRFLYPETIRGTAVLVLENEERSDDLFVYLPAVRLTRRLSSSQRGDSFFGTDLSYEDVEPKRITDYNVVWASDEDVTPSQLADATNAGCTLLDVRGTAEFDSAYDRQVTCVETARSIIIWTDYYRSGKFLKRLSLDPADVRMVGDRHIPFLITVETPQRHSITKVITETYELRAKISDRLFDTWNLSAGDIKSDRRKSKPMPEPPEPNNEGL